MRYRIVSLVLIAFMATGFSWGSKKEKKVEPEPSYRTSAPKSSSASKTATSAPRAATAVPADTEEFPSELIGALAKGNEEERQARIASLKRLSVALSEMKQKNAASEGPSASPESAKQTSWRTSY